MRRKRCSSDKRSGNLILGKISAGRLGGETQDSLQPVEPSAKTGDAMVSSQSVPAVDQTAPRPHAEATGALWRLEEITFPFQMLLQWNLAVARKVEGQGHALRRVIQSMNMKLQAPSQVAKRRHITMGCVAS